MAKSLHKELGIVKCPTPAIMAIILPIITDEDKQFCNFDRTFKVIQTFSSSLTVVHNKLEGLPCVIFTGIAKSLLEKWGTAKCFTMVRSCHTRKY